MYSTLLSEVRCIYTKVATLLVMLMFLQSASYGSRIPAANHSQLTLRGLYSKGNGREDKNASRCLLSYSNMDPREISKFKDASGKVGSGVYGGNVVWLGSLSECKNLHESRYCLVIFDALLYMDKHWIEINKLEYGVCTPKQCTKDNVKDVLGFILKNISMIQIKPDPKKLRGSIHCVNDEEYTTGVVLTMNSEAQYCSKAKVYLNTDCIRQIIKGELETKIKFVLFERTPKIANVLCGVFLFLCLLATIFELIKDFYKEKEASTLENSDKFPMDKTADEKTPLISEIEKADTPKIKNKTKVTSYKLLNCFSLIKNTNFILSTNVGKSDVTYLHGIRVLSLFWIIILHYTNFIIPLFGMPNTGKLTDNDHDVLRFYQRVTIMGPMSGALAVDTFFLLSGLLVMYVNLKKMEKNDGKMNWIKFYFHRFWRLTPSYMFAILFLTKLLPFFGDGPLWYEVRGETDGCSDYWWTNLLYINNFHPKMGDGNCLGHTWYLAVDMQFFVVSPILIIIALRFGFKAFLTFASVLILASMVTIAGLVGDEDSYPVMGLDRETMDSFMNHFIKDVYRKPYCRIQPYLVGMVLGYMIFKSLGRKIRVRWYLAVLFWSVAVSTSLAILYAPHNTMKDNPHEWSKGEKVVFGSLRWFLFSLAVGWVIFACEYGYAGLVKNILSAKFWIPLSRINYAAFILHMAVIRTVINNIESAIHFDTFAYVNYFLSSLVLTYACAFIFAVVVELPFANLEFLVLNR